MDREETGKTFDMMAEFTDKFRVLADELERAETEQEIQASRIERDKEKCPGHVEGYVKATREAAHALDDFILETAKALLKVEGVDIADLESTATLYGGRLMHVRWTKDNY